MALNDGRLKVLDTRMGAVANTWQALPLGLFSRENTALQAMIVDDNGAYIAAGTGSGRVVTLDARIGMLESSWVAQDAEVTDLVSLTRERLLCSASNGTLSLLDLPSRTTASRCRLTHHDPVTSVSMIGKDAVMLQPHNRVSVLRQVEGQPPVATADTHRLKSFRGGSASVLRAMPYNQWLIIGSEGGPVSVWA